MTHDHNLWGAAFDDKASLAFTWGDDGKVKLWDVATGLQLDSTFEPPAGAAQRVHGDVRGALFDAATNRILAWTFLGSAGLFELPGDLDFPSEHIELQAQVLTGISWNATGPRDQPLPAADWRQLLERYLEIARKHREDCKHPRQNILQVLFAEELD